MRNFRIIFIFSLGLFALSLYNVFNIPRENKLDLKQSVEENLAQEKILAQNYIDTYKAAKYTPKSDDLLFFVMQKDSFIYWNNSQFTINIDEFQNKMIIQKSHVLLKIDTEYIDSFKTAFVFLVLENNFLVNNDLLKSGLNSKLFGHSIGKIFLKPVENSIPIHFNKTVFYVLIDFEKHFELQNLNLFVLYVSFLILFILSVSYVLKKRKPLVTLFVCLISLVDVQLIIYFLLLNFDVFIYKGSEFETDFYSIVFDLIVFGAFLIIINSNRRILIELLKKYSKNTLLYAFTTFLAMMVLLLLAAFYFVMTNFAIELSINFFFDFSERTFLILLLLLAIGTALLLIFLFFNYCVLKLNLRTLAFSTQQAIFLLVPFILVFLISSYFFDNIEKSYLIFLFLLSYCSVLFIRLEPLFILNFKTYLFLIAFVSQIALVFLAVLVTIEQQKEQLEQQTLTDKLLIQNDYLGESLLDKLDSDLKNDPFIQEKLSNPFGAKLFIQNKIEKYYLNNYFDKYDVDVHVLNKLDVQFENYETSLNVLFNEKKINLKRTEYDNLFIENTTKYTPFIRYIKIIDLDDFKALNATIVLELKLREVKPNSVIPFLVLDKKHIENSLEKYSYAIYDEDELIYANGFFNYNNFDFSEKYSNGYIHFVNNIDNKKIVISSPNEIILFQLSNFAFFFILSWILLQIIIICYLFFRFLNDKSYTISILTKIQLLVNFVIIIPLIILSALMIQIEREHYFEDLEKKYSNKIDAITLDLLPYCEPNTAKFELEEALKNCAKKNQLDLILYDTNGIALSFSQSLLPERKLYSKLINPDALSQFQTTNLFFLDEKIGNLSYKSLYFTMIKNAKTIAYLSVPYFQSTAELNEKLSIYLVRILSIFIIIFFLSALISYWSSRSFSKPLSLLYSKLNAISLKENTPINWDSNDEVGLLIKEYNLMIQKLKINTQLLAKQEKESAWKEMAKQVAHEIKNPLTPMRLNLQMMEKTIGKSEFDTDKYKNIIKSLIVQIDILDEITKSFSSFAAMPEAKNKYIDVVELIQKTIELHQQTSLIEFQSTTLSSNIVFCDPQLMGRVLTNLLLNGIQATENQEKAKILISITESNDFALISIKDYGSGIPLEIQNKVFLPNFSTKFTGSGIGLALAKKTVEEANGEIYFETKEGVGTTFYIKLPLVLDEN